MWSLSHLGSPRLVAAQPTPHRRSGLRRRCEKLRPGSGGESDRMEMSLPKKNEMFQKMTYIKGKTCRWFISTSDNKLWGLVKQDIGEPSIEKNMNRLPNIGKSDLNAKTWESNPQKIQQ